MKVEIRANSVVIEGYVNAVERNSKVLPGRAGKFVERIKAGVFRRAIERAKRTGREIKVLLNHDYSRELTSTREQTTQITEDNIGLRCRCEIRDKDVIEKARKRELVGWSFGFIPLKEDVTEGEIKQRDVRELELREVSILDKSKIPAYDGTSIETRAETLDDVIELRFVNDEIEVTEERAEERNNYIFENRYYATGAN